MSLDSVVPLDDFTVSVESCDQINQPAGHPSERAFLSQQNGPAPGPAERKPCGDESIAPLAMLALWRGPDQRRAG